MSAVTLTPEMEATLKRAAATLREAEIPFLLSGTLASWARGGPVSTNDLDFIVKPDDAERALQALAGAGMRPERPPENWLVKAWDGEVLIDLIYTPTGLKVDDSLFARGEELNVVAIPMRVLALEDLMASKLLALDEHSLDYEALLQITRSLREQIDWGEVRSRTGESPYARAFFALIEELGLLERPSAASARPHIRVASAPRGR